MSYCSKCGFQIQSGDRFCMKCGTPVERLCPKCGTYYEIDQKFCVKCGNALANSDQMPQTTKTSVQYQSASSSTIAFYIIAVIMIFVSGVFILAPFIPTWSVKQVLSEDNSISIVTLAQSLDLYDFSEQPLLILCLFHFFVCHILYFISIFQLIAKRENAFWSLLQISGMFSFVALILWIFQMHLIKSELSKSHSIFSVSSDALNPTTYLYISLFISLAVFVISAFLRGRFGNAKETSKM